MKNIGLKTLVQLIFTLSSLVSIAQPSLGSRSGYSAVCVEEQVTGFNWQNKRWVKANFQVETFIVSRIPLEKYKSIVDARANTILLCSDKSGDNYSYGNTDYVHECYSVSKLGEKPSILDSNMCLEVWENKKLQSVSCNNHSSKLAFQPAGGFIKQPWHSDVRLDEQQKDSLTLSVGKCTPI